MKPISQAVPDAVEFDRQVVAGLQRAVEHTVTTTTMKARAEHRWQDRTGVTRKSIDGEVSTTSTGASGVVGANVNAERLNFGTRPHRIEAGGAAVSAFGRAAVIGKHALRFQVGGQTIFRRAVNHPGTKPDPFLDAAAEYAGEEVARSVEEAIGKALG